MSDQPFHDIPLLSAEFLARMLRQTELLSTPTVAITPSEVMSETKPAKPKEQTRCPTCRHKLHLADTTCRCGLRHCSAHRLPETHACTFDYKGHDQALLKKQVVACVADKITERL
jgi:predicted nucleic acid binding AN1-type Zn finger protein